ncbi:hypothetical protein MKX01_021243 [Papaver californicum]|nr:hypothetical protein MKX01_021243 [Papaver californicum]
MVGDNKTVTYADMSLERGAFLVQQAMRAFRSQNILSAKSRLSLYAEDIREQLERLGNTSELCSQLGAVPGMLGDCCRAMGHAGSAISYFEESAEFLSKFLTEDMEVNHTLSVSLNKIGDLKYYEGDLQAARSLLTGYLSDMICVYFVALSPSYSTSTLHREFLRISQLFPVSFFFV